MEERLLLLIVLVSTTGIAAQWLAWRLGLPVIILLLLAGFLLGPTLGILLPEADLGPLLGPAISLAVAIVVLQEGLNLNFTELRTIGLDFPRVIGLGLVLIGLGNAAAAHFIAGLSWPIAALLGVMLVITGPTVVSPLLRQARLEHRAEALLRWESVVSEPLGAVLTVIVLEVVLVLDRVLQIQQPIFDVMIALAAGSLLSAALGVGSGFVMRFMFLRGYVPEFLKSPLVLAIGFLIYTLSDIVQPEAGLIAVALFGVALANLDLPEIADLRRFKESLSTFLVSGIFVVLAATVDIGEILELDWRSFAFIAVVLLLVRPLAIGITSIGSELTWNERLFAGLIAPRGIVVAALAGFAGTRLAGSDYPDADLVVPLVFSVIIATVVLHGFTFGPLSRALNLASDRPPGLVIVGASDWTIALTKVLTRLGTPVVLSDRSARALEPAEGLAATTHTGHLLAPEEEEEELLSEAQFLLAATEDDAFNALVCRKFATDFGQYNVFQVAYGNPEDQAHRFHREWRGNILIREGITLADLNRRLAEGWRFTLRPAEREDTREALHSPSETSLPVVLVRRNGQLLFASPETELSADIHGILVLFEAPAGPRTAGPEGSGEQASGGPTEAGPMRAGR